MTKISFYIIAFLLELLLVCCNGSTTSENNIVNNKSVNDTTFVKDTIESSTEISIQSEITCPKCGHKKMETLPTDVCLIKYNCEKCDTTLFPKEGDCCVFCTYGTHKCPSKQSS